jgi:hypothetical protein
MTFLGILLSALLLSPTPGLDDLPEEVDDTPGSAAHNFLSRLVAAELDDLVKLGTDPFTFDGRILKGQEEIKACWKRFLARNKRELEFLLKGETTIYDYNAAVEKFGVPPKKFSHLRLKQCKFAVFTFAKRNGVVLILSPDKKKGWRVTAVTD